jgi:hypothetical protein
MTRIPTVPGVPGFAGVYMRHRALWEAFRVSYGTLWAYGKLDPVVKDLCRIKSAALHGCDF